MDVQIEPVVGVLFTLLTLIDESFLIPNKNGDILNQLELIREQLRRHLLVLKQLCKLRHRLAELAFRCALAKLVGVNSPIKLAERVLRKERAAL